MYATILFFLFKLTQSLTIVSKNLEMVINFFFASVTMAAGSHIVSWIYFYQKKIKILSIKKSLTICGHHVLIFTENLFQFLFKGKLYVYMHDIIYTTTYLDHRVPPPIQVHNYRWMTRTCCYIVLRSHKEMSDTRQHLRITWVIKWFVVRLIAYELRVSYVISVNNKCFNRW